MLAVLRGAYHKPTVVVLTQSLTLTLIAYHKPAVVVEPN